MFILQSQNVTMYRAFAIWRSKTRVSILVPIAFQYI
jgi:hypothetical protein